MSWTTERCTTSEIPGFGVEGIDGWRWSLHLNGSSWHKQWMIWWLCEISTAWFMFTHHLDRIEMEGIQVNLIASGWLREIRFSELIRFLADALWALPDCIFSNIFTKGDCPLPQSYDGMTLEIRSVALCSFMLCIILPLWVYFDTTFFSFLTRLVPLALQGTDSQDTRGWCEMSSFMPNSCETKTLWR